MGKQKGSEVKSRKSPTYEWEKSLDRLQTKRSGGILHYNRTRTTLGHHRRDQKRARTVESIQDAVKVDKPET